MLAFGVLLAFPGFNSTSAAAIVAFSGAMLVAVAAGRACASALVSACLRTAGFEMVWNTPKRVARTARGGTIELRSRVAQSWHR